MRRLSEKQKKQRILDGQARKKGYGSHKEYRKVIDEEKRSRTEQREELSALIKYGLGTSAISNPENPLSKKMLADRIGVSKQMLENYIQEICLPGEEVLQRLFRELQVPYTSLEELVSEFRNFEYFGP